MEVHMPVKEFLEVQNGRIFKGDKVKEYKQEVIPMEVEKQLIEHSYELKELKNIIGSVANTQKETNLQIRTLTEGFNKLDLFLEKQTNMENRHSDSMNRIHKRIDDVECDIKAHKDLVSEYKVMKKTVEDIDNIRNKLIWGVLTAVGMGVLGLVIK